MPATVSLYHPLINLIWLCGMRSAPFFFSWTLAQFSRVHRFCLSNTCMLRAGLRDEAFVLRYSSSPMSLYIRPEAAQ